MSVQGHGRGYRRATFWVVGAVSATVHLLLVAALPTAPRGEVPPISVEIVDVGHGQGEGSLQDGPAQPANEARLPRPGGRHAAQNISAPSQGRGGDRLGASEVIYLLDRAHAVTLQDSPMNAPKVAQTQRIDTSRQRVSRELRRATPHPADAPFLASGHGTLRERRPLARRDPAPGARPPHPPSGRGRADGSRSAQSASEASAQRTSPGGWRTETARPSQPGRDQPAQGVLRTHGTHASARANSAHDRPRVDEGPAATNAAVKADTVRDNTSAELLAASMVQSMVESTQRRGTATGPGEGGRDAPFPPGNGNQLRAGGRTGAYGPGRGDHALDTADSRYRRWFVSLTRRVRERLEFPRARLVAMDQGMSVYRIRVRRDGTLARRPELVRTSGFDDLDAAAADAIRKAAPFSPFPDDLAPNQATLAVTMRVEHANPMVR